MTDSPEVQTRCVDYLQRLAAHLGDLRQEMAGGLCSCQAQQRIKLLQVQAAGWARCLENPVPDPRRAEAYRPPGERRKVVLASDEGAVAPVAAAPPASPGPAQDVQTVAPASGCKEQTRPGVAAIAPALAQQRLSWRGQAAIPVQLRQIPEQDPAAPGWPGRFVLTGNTPAGAADAADQGPNPHRGSKEHGPY